MDIIIYNVKWMSFNTFLALIPVVLGFLFFKNTHPLLKLIIFGLWLVFLPNTIYLLTDIIHLSEDLHFLPPVLDMVVGGMYTILVVLGLVTYFLSIQLVLGKPHVKRKEEYLIRLIVIHFLVGVGLILGRVYRFNSWDILHEPRHILFITYSILSTPKYITILLLFTIGTTCMSFGFFNLFPSYLFAKKKSK